MRGDGEVYLRARFAGTELSPPTAHAWLARCCRPLTPKLKQPGRIRFRAFFCTEADFVSSVISAYSKKRAILSSLDSTLLSNKHAGG